ncbi:MAG: hypothetical protein A3F09_04605 [Chlamydiae bacterium RIFCSPHIGHO2_12_FULL_49_11]|nr:MAG: hypothetical protein A3F09_04605 [Chlamydiae bacterium RIFCSPHIGHO2_12_FULL_49_11]
MKIVRLLFLLLVVHGFADNVSPLSDNEISQLKEWIATKRQVTIQQTGGNFSLAGDVRTIYGTISEIKDGFKNVGSNSLNPTKANDTFYIQLNLNFDYRLPHAWLSAKLDYNNVMGATDGTNDNIALTRAFLGCRLARTSFFTLDIEFGRRPLWYSFDSKIEFAATFDGILIKYDQFSERYGDFYIRGGPFVVNQVRNQFAWIIETAILNVMNTGLYGKYSIIDWDTKSFSTQFLEERFGYCNSQFILGYKFVMPYIHQTTTVFAAFLVNSAAKGRDVTNYVKANLGWYAGFSIGTVRKKGDWSTSFNFQVVQPQAVPDFDLTGIGIGNAAAVGLYNTKYDGTGTATTYANAAGKNNYWGWRADFLYLITDNFTISQNFSWARSMDFLPTKFFYKKYQVQVIYAF